MLRGILLLRANVKKLFNLEKDLFSKEKRNLSLIFLSVFILLVFIGGMIPDLKYDLFCSSGSRTVIFKDEFKSPIDVFKYSLCKAKDDIDQKSVEYVLHIFTFALKTLIWFIASILLGYFLKRNHFMDIFMMACAFFFWMLAMMIYISAYTGWF